MNFTLYKWLLFLAMFIQCKNTIYCQDFILFSYCVQVVNLKKICWMTTVDGCIPRHILKMLIGLRRFKLARTPALRRRRRNKIAFSIETCWQRGSHLPPLVSHWMYQPHSRSGLCPAMIGQHKADSMIFVFDFVLFYCIIFVLLILF